MASALRLLSTSSAVLLVLFSVAGCDSTSPAPTEKHVGIDEPVLLAPLANKTTTAHDDIAFQWTSVEKAVAYELQIQSLGEAADALTFHTAVSTLTLTVERLGEQTWRVRAIDGRDRVGYWSESRRISVVHAP